MNITMRKWAMRALKFYAQKTGMTCEWRGPSIYGYDKTKKLWVCVYNGTCQ